MNSNLKTFKLIENSKLPAEKWSEGKNIIFNELPKLKPTQSKGIVKGYNLGVYTGKMNEITVIDIDIYKMNENNKFIKDYGLDYILKQNTFTVKTPKGGYHLYFQYDVEIKTTANKEIQIDVRNDEAYVVSPKSIINGKKYEIIKNVEYKKIDDDFKEWILTNLYEVRPKIKLFTENNIYYKLNDVDYTEDFINEFKSTLEKTEKDLFIKSNGFLKFTNCCKILNLKSEWDNYNKTKENYNLENNNLIWNTTKTDKYNMVNYICKELEINTNFLLFKPTLKNLIEPTYKTEYKKLPYTFYTDLNDKYYNTNGEKYFLFNTLHYVVKSDTGTGKTTSFKKYIKNTNQKFISIVSRISLGLAQYNTFAEDEINTKFYNYENKFHKNDNIIIQLDSIKRLIEIDNINFNEYIIFLDEFNSIIDYLIQSSTLNKNRVLIYQFLTRILKECKQIICVDADITDICLDYLNYNEITYNFIQNSYIHNKGVIAEELNGVELFYNKIKTEEKFLCCFDSKTEAEILHKKLEKDNIECLLITSDSGDEYINFDEHNRIIYSPKIIYGIDSVMERPVYCYYKEQTINPKSMVQQIARCRNITKLYYYFSNKKYYHNNDSFNDVGNQLTKTNAYSNTEFKFITDKTTYDNYFKLIVKYEYNNKSYNTNKFTHFLNILDERGFIRNKVIEINIKSPKNFTKEIKDEIKAEKHLNFNPEDEKYKKLVEMLKIPNEDTYKYIEFFLENHKINNHFNIINYMFEDLEDIKDKIKNTKDFNINKIREDKSKVIFLKKLKEYCNNTDIKTIKSVGVSKEISDKIHNEFILSFSKIQKKDYTDPYECDKLQVKIYKSLFGFNIVSTKKDSKKDENGLQKYKFTVDKEEINKNVSLYLYRQNKEVDFIN